MLSLLQTFESFEKIPKDAPIIVNLNEDPLISEKMCYSLKKYPVIEIGRKTNKKKNLRIVLNSVGIIENHAFIKWDGKNVYLES